MAGWSVRYASGNDLTDIGKKPMSYKFVCFSEDDIHVEVESDDAVDFRKQLVDVGFKEKIESIPLFNQAYRIVLPNGDELRGMRATRWFVQNA
jgi:hypothetical protein